MMKSIYSFVSRVGEFKNIPEQGPDALRPVEAVTAKNVMDLTATLCSNDQTEQLLAYDEPKQPDGIPSMSTDVAWDPFSANLPGQKERDEFGKLVTVLVACVGGLPLQTPCYAALSLAIHEKVKTTRWSGFMERCISCALQHIAKDLDAVLLEGKGICDCVCRLKLLLRYLAILARMNIVKAFDEGEPSNDSKLTLVEFVCSIVTAASNAYNANPKSSAAAILIHLVLSTVPYIASFTPAAVLDEKIMQPIESFLSSYRSTFIPGRGRDAILTGKTVEEDFDDDESDEEDDDDGEEDEAAAAKQVCDSLQDLTRALKKALPSMDKFRFCLWKDSPWNGLVQSPPPEASVDGTDSAPQPITFSGEPIYLQFTRPCRALQFLVQGEGDFQLQCFHVDGVIFGRLPIFGHPHDPDNVDDDDEMDEAVTKNENLMAYINNFNLVDRGLIFEALRDCLLSHQPFVTKAGLQQGGAKHVAEEMLSIKHVLSDSVSSKGLEFAIIETIFGLIAQASDLTPLRRTYLARVLLELVRLMPGELSPALAIGMTNLFNDYLPSLSPAARESLCSWFAFHLANTDYQWPSAFWTFWSSKMTPDKFSCRGEFLIQTIAALGENSTSTKSIVEDCLPKESPLVDYILGKSAAPLVPVPQDSPIANLGRDVNSRVWESAEEAAAIFEALCANEASDTVAAWVDYSSDDMNQYWWRTCIASRVIFDPVRTEGQRCISNFDKVRNPVEDSMDDQEQTAENVFEALKDSVSRYSDLLKGVIAKDSETLSKHFNGERGQRDLEVCGEVYVLTQVDSLGGFSRGLVEACIELLVQHDTVSCMAVVHWMLGAANVKGSTAPPISRWWTIGCLSARLSVAKTLEEGKSQMGVDTDASKKVEIATAARDRLLEMAKWIIPRIESLIDALTASGDAKKVKGEKLNMALQTRELLTFYRKMFCKEIQDADLMAMDQVETLLEVFDACDSTVTNIVSKIK